MTRFPMQRTRITLVTALLLLSACGAAPAKPAETQQEAARVSATGVYGTLLQLQLPDGWKAVDESETNAAVIFALPSVIGSLHDANTDRDFFTVRPLGADSCDSQTIVVQAKMSQGEHPKPEDRPQPLTANGGTYGYVWNGFDGVAGGATDTTTRFWCITSARPSSDIEIRAVKVDAATTTFIEKTFIPLWQAAQK